MNQAAMVHMILGRKGRMTQVFTEDGRCVPVTIVEAGPCTVTQVRTPEKDGYRAVQIAFEPVAEKALSRPVAGHLKKANVAPHRVLREVRLDAAADAPAPGSVYDCTIFERGGYVDVIGLIKGRGTAGVMKRHGFSGRPASHGHMCQRRPGSIGMHSYPARVWKGKRMAGRYGHTRTTVQNLEVVGVDGPNRILLIKGAVPGPRGGLLMIRAARKRPSGKKG
jgi:large subunit ribosomal protein L3